MNESDPTGGPDDDATAAREALSPQFTTLWQEHAPRVRAIVAAGKCDDPEALVGEVARKTWQAFPATVKRERKRVTEGWPGYNWPKWFARTAERVVIDARRRVRTARRAYGYRAEIAPLDCQRFPDRHDSPHDGEVGAPLDVDLVADAAPANDPAVAAERAAAIEALSKALTTLSNAEAKCLLGWARGEHNWETAASIGMGWQRLVALRASALEKVRQEMARLGWT